MATHALTIPAYRLGTHPRRTDHPALLTGAGGLALTFAIDATRAEIAEKLQSGGLTLHADDTVTEAPPLPTRRRLLSGLTGAAAAASMLAIAMPRDASAAAHPDAELLGLCAQFDALELQAYPPNAPPVRTLEAEAAQDDARQPLLDQQDPLLDRMCALPTRSLDGFRARARSLVLWDKEMPKAIAAGDNPGGYIDDRMIVALLRDLAGERHA